MDNASDYAARRAQHHSYLLRLWRGGENGGWRASLQSIQTSERHMFADLESLLAFLVSHPWPPELIRHDQPDGTSVD